MNRLQSQIQFILEIDKLKTILRRTLLLDQSRRENSAEHSWHAAVMAPLLAEYSAEPVDVSRVIQMLLVHDLVEIDAGDTFCYDVQGNLSKAERERCCADRIFALLPDDQGLPLRRIWEEFESGNTPEARFAAALDRLQPLLHNYQTQGASWREHGVRYQQVIDRNAHMAAWAPNLWAYTQRLLDEAVSKGYLQK